MIVLQPQNDHVSTREREQFWSRKSGEITVLAAGELHDILLAKLFSLDVLWGIYAFSPGELEKSFNERGFVMIHARFSRAGRSFRER